MKVIKKYTVREWKKLYKIQETLCKKFDVILTDHKTNKEQLVLILKNINFKNINKGIDTFNKIIQDFGGSMEKLTSEMDQMPQNNVKIWSDVTEIHSQNKDQENLERIWGKK